MKTLTRKNLSDLARVMLRISEREQRSYVGGGTGTYEDPYTIAEFDMMCANGTWNGGYVEEWGYTFPDVISYGYYGGDDDPWGYYNPYNPWGYYGDGGYTPPGYYPGFPGDNSGYGGYGYGYDYYYDEHYDYGYYGGGSGDGTSGGNDNPSENQLKWDLLYQEFLDRAATLGFDLSEFCIFVGDGTGRAGKDDEGNIFIYDSFFDQPTNDQFSVIIHECAHIESDIPYDEDFKINVEDADFSTAMSESARRYFSSINYGNTEEEIVATLKQLYGTGSYSHPQRFLNEIAAYEREIQLCPNVSEEYRNEREGKLYQYREFYRIAIETMSNQ